MHLYLLYVFLPSPSNTLFFFLQYLLTSYSLTMQPLLTAHILCNFTIHEKTRNKEVMPIISILPVYF